MFPFLIVSTIFSFVVVIVKMALKHSENIERIRHGYEPIGGTHNLNLSKASEPVIEYDDRLQ